MEIRSKNVLVLGGAGLVGRAVCRELLAHEPARIAVAARSREKTEGVARGIRDEAGDSKVRLVPVWGDVLLRAEWQQAVPAPREAIVADATTRHRLVADILEPLDDEIVEASLLWGLIGGGAPGLEATGADVVVDCMNTATAVSYADFYGAASRARDLAARGAPEAEAALDALLAATALPALVRHVQLLYECMRRAGTEAYVKVGTTGTGGFGFNIPYTHGEERPSRPLLSKAAVAGAQTSLIFLMARTPGAPRVVKEVKPAATIAWREIAHGPIRVRGREVPLYDCLAPDAVSPGDPHSLTRSGAFGAATGETLRGVYIDTGENGLFSADEFMAITAPGQMAFLTPEEIARDVVRELTGANTGRDVVAALDGAVMGPSYRAGHLREVALGRLRRLEREHGPSIAFECLGPPRLSKLLFEAHLLKRACGRYSQAPGRDPDELAAAMEAEVLADAGLRQRILSIGIPILLADGERLLRGPTIKSEEASKGWVDLTTGNVTAWVRRLERLLHDAGGAEGADSSSRPDRLLLPRTGGDRTEPDVEPGEIAAWVFVNEEGGRREKC